MGRFQISYTNQEAEDKKPPEIHPIWRGIGFVLIILIPVLSYFTGVWLIDANKLHPFVTIPPDLLAPKGDPDLYLKILLTVVIACLIYALFTLITFVAYGLFGPSRYGPTDAPPIRRKIQKRTK